MFWKPPPDIRECGAAEAQASATTWLVQSLSTACSIPVQVVCIREVQKTLNQSAKALIENKIQEFGVGSQFRVLFDRIETPGGGLIIFQGMQDMNAESIKSLEGYNIAWVEEAQTLSARSSPYYVRPFERMDLRSGSPGTRDASRMRLMSSCAARSPTTQSS